MRKKIIEFIKNDSFVNAYFITKTDKTDTTPHSKYLFPFIHVFNKPIKQSFILICVYAN